MQDLKVHPLKYLQKKLHGHRSVLILGPLEIDPKILKKTILEIKPTIILLIDGGGRHIDKLTAREQKLTLSLGDGDSSKKEDQPFLLLPRKKNFSDIAFAIKGLTQSKIPFEDIALLGLSSKNQEKRLDHFLFTLGLVHHLIKKNPIVVKMDEQFLFIPSGVHRFFYRGTFSVIALESTMIQIQGKAQYRLNKWTKLTALNSLGLSNVGHGEIIIHTKKPLIIYLAGKITNS